MASDMDLMPLNLSKPQWNPNKYIWFNIKFPLNSIISHEIPIEPPKDGAPSFIYHKP